MKKTKSSRPRIIIQARKLIELAAEEGIAYRTAQRRKDKFALVLIQVGKNKQQKRYLDSKTTELLRASGLFS